MIKTPNNIMNNGFDTNDYIKMKLNSSELTEISWPLKVNITEFDVIERTLRVTGSTHIGGVMFQLVEQLGNIKNDWSDFALWWPEKNQWLKKTKMTLDQYGVQADALLHFTRIHKHLRVQMPDLQIIDLNVDYSNCLFNTVKQICKEMNIRNAEEISLIRIEQLEDNNKKKNKNDLKMKGNKSNAILNSKSMISTASSVNNYSNKENDQFSVSSSTTSTLNNSSSNNSSSSKCNPRELSHSLSIENNINLNSVSNLSSNNDTQSLHLSPIVPTQFYLNKIAIKYKSLFDKTRINSRWLDSSKSLMEQNITENDLVQLRFKYFAFYDLNVKYDSIRINQIYEQAKWAILTEEIDCTEQELINFAALQLQIQLQTKSSNQIYSSKSIDFLNSSHSLSGKPNLTLNRLNSISLEEKIKYISTNNIIYNDQDDNNNNHDDVDDDDDIDTALSKLEKSLDVTPAVKTNLSNNETNKQINNSSKPPIQKKASFITDNINEKQKRIDSNRDYVEELCEDLFLMKQQKYTFKKYKSYFFVLNDTHYLSYYKCKEESNGKPIDKINLKGCELVPDVNVAGRKFGINLRVPSSDGMSEMSLRCPTEQSYAQWMSACKLASRNKSISDPTFKSEVNSILNLLNMQQKKHMNSSSYLLSNSENLFSHSKSIIGSTVSIDSKYINDNAEVQASNLLPLRMTKKYKLKQLNDRILEAYSSISDLDLIDSKWRYIKEWQGLPSYGISYFCVKIKGSRLKEDLIGVASNRLLKLNPEGETVKTWRFNTMKSWNVNWDIKQFEIIFDDENLTFTCVNCDAKILHEFIGGYIYLSLRAQEKSEPVDENMFFKLTERR